MEKVWFNPLNYWLMFTGLLVILDLIARRGMYLVLVGVGCFIAAFLASLGLGLTVQVSAFILVSIFLVVFYHEALLKKRTATLKGIDSVLDWLQNQEIVVIETIHGPWRPGSIIINGILFPAKAHRTIPEGTSVQITDRIIGGFLVKPKS